MTMSTKFRKHSAMSSQSVQRKKGVKKNKVPSKTIKARIAHTINKLKSRMSRKGISKKKNIRNISHNVGKHINTEVTRYQEIWAPAPNSTTDYAVLEALGLQRIWPEDITIVEDNITITPSKTRIWPQEITTEVEDITNEEDHITISPTKTKSKSAKNNNNAKLVNKNLTLQNKVKKIKDVNPTFKYRCKICKATFKSRAQFESHRINNHPTKRVYHCKICSTTFVDLTSFQKHKKRHSGERPYFCLQCNKTFVGLDSLTAHVRQHSGKLPYACKVCKESFRLYSDYLEHKPVHLLKKMEYTHQKIFKCNDCPKEFHKLCDLERHTRVHTGEKPYECNICKNRFQQAHNLTKHMIIHTQERHYQCEICNKQFGRSDVLTRHMITHKIEKPFPCMSCDKSFARHSQLNDHIKKYHEED